MKSLPNVTLISYDNSPQPERTLRALKHCASMIAFAEVVMVTHVVPQGVNGETLYMVTQNTYSDAMTFEVHDLAYYVSTDYALCIHHDGFIINPDAWRDEWLQYDFIGAPWPREAHPKHPGKSDFPNFRVGNTGFCMKSKRFINACYDLGHLFDIKSDTKNPSGLGGDTFVSQIIRPQLEAQGMKYAPVEVAADFSWESNIEEYPNGRPDAFGFHSFNLEDKRIPRA